MSEKKTEFFFSYKNGRSRQVSKEEWERAWLEWYEKVSSEQSDDGSN